MNLGRLMKRPEFLRVAAKGRKEVMPGLVLQVFARPAPHDDSAIRYGLTASKKVGNAVERNRARRRLRALAEELLPKLGQPGRDYVLIARAQTVRRAASLLKSDLERALVKLAKRSGA